jgi:glycosyltransferase involved in cell wall biosynthesis
MNFEEFTKELNISISKATDNKLPNYKPYTKEEQQKSSSTEELPSTISEKPVLLNEVVDIVKDSAVIDSAVIDSAKTDSMKKLKVLFVSTHINQVNGYSKVAHNLINQLAKNDWISLTHFATQCLKNADIQRKYPENVRVIDGSALDKSKEGTGFGFAELCNVIRNETPDIVFIYNDIIVINGYIEELHKAFTGRSFKLWAYIDTMYNAIPQSLIDTVNRDVDRVFSFTKSWKEELKRCGVIRPVDVMNHGIDNKMFRSIPRELARQSVGLPKEAFIFLSLNRNQPRKRLDLLIMSFVELITKHPIRPIFMLIIGDRGDQGGYQLFDIFSRELKIRGGSVDTFGNRLMITSSNSCYKDEDINVFYNMADACVSCAEGEGFGLCTFESMSVGIPQIVPKIKGYTEYCNINNSLIIEPKVRYYLPQAYNMITGEAEVVDVKDVVEAMEQYVFDDELRRLHGKRGKETVSEYTWEKAVKTFIRRLHYEYEEEDD